MHCLRCELVAQHPLNMPPNVENLLFLVVGLVLIYSLILALCIFEKVGLGQSFGTASGVCASALALYVLTREKRKTNANSAGFRERKL
ncbi:hypothetical protein D3C76_1032550 [compost metagenome]